MSQKHSKTIFPLLLFFFCHGAFAEGSRELNLSTNPLSYRVMFDFGYPIPGATKNWYKITSQDSISAQNRFHAYCNVGEVLTFSSSALGIRAVGSILGGSIFVYNPAGVLVASHTTPGASGAGLYPTGAGSKLKEMQGPFGIYSGGAGGYVPLTYTIPSGGAGIYTIEFSSPAADIATATGGNYGGGSVCVPRANQDFIQMTGNNTTISGIDVSVFNSTLSAILTGRVFTRSMSLTGGQQQQPSSAACMVNVGGTNYRPYIAHNYSLYALTREGLRYDISISDLIGYGYLMYTDNVGVQLGNGETPAYESIQYQGIVVNNRRIHNVTDPETVTETKHKMFFNTPSSSMPKTADMMGATTWLYPEQVLSSTYIDNFTFTSQPTISIFPLAGYFTFDFPNYNCGFFIDIDITGDGDYDDPEDVILSGTTVVGTNTVNYDGRDGLGNYPVVSISNCTAARLRFNRSEIHVPLLDVENFRGGLQLKRINGHGVLPDFTLHYNDVPLNDLNDIPPGSYPKSSPAAGFNSSTFVHRWERTESNVNFPGYTGSPTHSTNYGDTRYIDNWAWDTLPTRYIPALICGILDSKINYFNISNTTPRKLQWSLSLHNGTKAYLEYSTDGTNFAVLKEITGQNNGTYTISNSLYKYNYYRIALKTTQQRVKYSSVKKIVQIIPNTITIYPTIAKNSLQVEALGGNLIKHISVMNNNGITTLKYLNLNKTAIILPVSNLPSGLYQIVVEEKNGNIIRKQFIKI